MRFALCLGLLTLAACSDGGSSGSDTTDTTDTGTSTSTTGDGYPNHAFASGTLTGCSTDISWQTWTYDAGTPTATLVFTNGRTEYTDKYHHLIPMLQDQPWNIVMWDQFGQGRSGGPRAHADDFETQHVCDFDTVIDQQVDPTLPMLLVSHSTGGLIQARWMAENPGRAKAAVFGSPLFGLNLDGFSESFACSIAATNVASDMGLVPTGPSNPRGPCETNEVTHDCELYEQFKDDPLTTIGDATWGWVNAVCLAMTDNRASYGLIAEPTRILRAGDELVVDPEQEQLWCDGVVAAGGDCTLSTYPGDWHELYNELDRDAVVDETVTFLNEHL